MLGRYDLTNITEVGWIERSLVSNINHPEYENILIQDGTKNARSHADITILIMDNLVTFTDFIIPICLPSSTINAFKVDGIVAGYGIMDIVTRKTSPTPRHVAMSTVGLDVCFASDKDSSTTVSSRSFCAKGNESSPCGGKIDIIFNFFLKSFIFLGDSGGGFYTDEKKRWTLLGVVSYSMNDECSPKDFVAFTRIPLFIDFIIKNAKGYVDFPDFYECTDNASMRIPFRLKCDGKEECSDGNDEVNCSE